MIAETKWYETDVMRAVQEQFNETATELCEEAREEGLSLPFEIEFTDDSSKIGGVATFTLEEDRGDWTWMPWAKSGDITNPITAALRSNGNLKVAEIQRTFRVDALD